MNEHRANKQNLQKKKFKYARKKKGKKIKLPKPELQ